MIRWNVRKFMCSKPEEAGAINGTFDGGIDAKDRSAIQIRNPDIANFQVFDGGEHNLGVVKPMVNSE